LIIFSRYPVPGQTKTRMIPRLGPLGAANWQAQLTEWTAFWARRSRDQMGLDIWVAVNGAPTRAFREWLGHDLVFYQQRGRDLGARMRHAAASALTRGYRRALLVGIDCPQVSPAIIVQAFGLLQAHEAVVGPAADGGYYLLGMTRVLPGIFHNMEWGAPDVYAETMRRLASANIKAAVLPILSDCDQPQDWEVWEQATRQVDTPKISVIIPALNESSSIAAVVKSALSAPRVEVIVVDGGSQDDTVRIAQAAGAKVVPTAAGRARQCNLGAATASGEYLLFLHADTLLPDGYWTSVLMHLETPGVIAGAFRLQIHGPERGLRLIEKWANWRSCFLGMPYGDQALFCTAERFRSIGGFAELPIMEDFEWVRRVRKQGRVWIARSAVFTSDRRWRNLGPLRTTLRNQLIVLGFLLKIPPEKLARLYRREQGIRTLGNPER
jgi:hypothetical protein